MGKFDTHGGFFAPQGYFKVNTGGSHAENPNGGVQIGVDQQGVPNMLEEGEPVYNDYVYSDNIRLTKEMAEKYNIPTKYVGMLYSEIADAYVDEADERPNDAISNNGLNAMLVRLASAQEEQKQIEEQRALEEELKNLSPEELAQLEQMLAQQEQGGEVAPEQIAPEQIAPEQIPVQQFDAGGKINNPFYNTALQILNQQEQPEILGVDPLLVAKEAQMAADRISNPSILTEHTRANRPSLDMYRFPLAIGTNSAGLPVNFSSISPSPLRSKTSEEQEASAPALPTWSRYAGPFIAGASLLHNLAQEDNSYYVPDVTTALPTGTMHTVPYEYLAIDPNLNLNAIRAQGNAGLRALRNSGLGPSTGAAIIAADNNLTNALGTGFIQSWADANSRRNAVIGANNAIDQQKAEYDFKVMQAQAMALNQAKDLRARYDMLRQQLEHADDEQEAAAISSQLNAIAIALSDIGRQNFIINQINGNTALVNGVNPNGTPTLLR